MILEELKLIRDLLAIHSDAKLHSTYPKAIEVILREIRLKELDPVRGTLRSEGNDNHGG